MRRRPRGAGADREPVGGRAARLSGQTGAHHRALHAGLAQRRDGAAAGAAPARQARPGDRDRQQARRRHDHRLQDGRGRACRRLHAAVRKLGPRHRADHDQAGEYDPLKDFTPIAFVARTASMLTINAQVPANSVTEFVAYAKANPGKLSLGFAQGTVSQLLAEYFNHLHGLDITSVPYRGGALVIPDMLGGRIHVYWPTPATVLPLIREGKIKALAITSPQRNPDLPDVPTMTELGLPELSLEFWAGMWAPGGTPADIVDKLNAAINAALQSPEMIASMKKLGFELSIGSAWTFET